MMANPQDAENFLIVTDQDAEQHESLGERSASIDWSSLVLGLREDPMSSYELKRKKDRGILVNDPDFQRNMVWKPKQQARFIESVLLNFPLPPLYVNENIEGKWEVIDGRQRTTTLFDFMDNKFPLQGLEVLDQYNQAYFKDLPGNLQAKIEDKKLLIYILQHSTPIAVVYELLTV